MHPNYWSLHTRFRFTAVLFLFLAYITDAQSRQSNFPAINIVSPSATSLQKHVDFPVNYHTGVPEVNIPIHTVEEGPIKIPIMLSYHASGLQVTEVASWVGAGWSLSSGGVISRTVKGLPDETVSEQSQTSFYSNRGFSYYYLDPVSYNYKPEGFAHYPAFSGGAKDGEPDIFTFNFCGQGGKFYIRGDGTPVTLPRSDLKIEIETKGQTNSVGTFDYFQRFIITTVDGMKYYFGVTPQAGDVDPIEKSRVYTMSNGLSFSDVISSWYLYKIQSPDNKFEVNLKYRSEDYGFISVSTSPCLPDCSLPAASKIIVTGVAIEQIISTNATIDFIASTIREDLSQSSVGDWDLVNGTAKALNTIHVSSNHTDHCISYNFSYDYFSDNSSTPLPYALTRLMVPYNTDRKRLKLLALQKATCNDTDALPAYQFSYYDEELVPRRLSFAQDHWGFFNGAGSNATLLPTLHFGSGPLVGDERDASWPSMRAGTLRMIQYPEGGGAEYEYEPNSVAITKNCTFEHSNTVVASSQAGMNGPAAGFGNAQNLEVSARTAYYYNLSSQTGGSGFFTINGDIIASVDPGAATVQDYVVLDPGTYTINTYANSDGGHGIGVLVVFYQASFSSCDASQMLVGGLRIKRINTFGNRDSPQLSRRYEYQQANLYSIPTYVSKAKHEMFKGNSPETNVTENGCVVDPNTGNMRLLYSPKSIHPLQSVQGYHIGYNVVREYSKDGGYTQYGYSGTMKLPSEWYTLEDVCLRALDFTSCSWKDPVYPQPPAPFEFSRGRLKSKRVFNSANVMLKESVFDEQYETDAVGAFGVLTSNAFGIHSLPTHYDILSARMLWSKETEKDFDGSGNSLIQEKTTYFESPHHNLPTRIGLVTPENSKDIKNTYVPDLTKCKVECLSCANEYKAAVAELTSLYSTKKMACRNYPEGCGAEFLGWPKAYGPCAQWVCSDVVENSCPLEYRKQTCELASWYDFQYRLNQARVAYSNCLAACETQAACIEEAITATANDDIKSLFLLEKSNQLHLLETALWDNTIFQHSNYFDYKSNGSDTEIYLRNVFRTEVSNINTSFTPVTASLSAIQRDASYHSQPLSSYKFENGQPIQITDRSGVTTSYIWENTVPIVKAVGVEHSALSSAHAEDPANIRSAPALQRAQITSYVHDPVVGVKTITDPNGRITSYEYDALGRLVRVKDHDGKIIEQYEYTYRIE